MAGKNRQHVEVIGELPVHRIGTHFGGEIRRVDQKHRTGRILVLIEHLSIVPRGNFQPFQIVETFRIIVFADIVIEGVLTHFGNAQLVLHRKHNRGRERDEIDISVFALLPLNAVEYALPNVSGDRLVPRNGIAYDFPNIGDQSIGARYVFKPLSVVVEIVVHHGGIRLAPLGDVGEQAGTSEQVDECDIVGKLFQNFYKLAREHALLPYERGRGRFIMVGNLISKTSVLANIAKTKGVHVSVIKAVDTNGEPVWKEKWTKGEALAYRDFVGYRAWEKEMMHNPIVDGSIFRNEWIRFKRLPKLSKYEMLVCYTDPSFKSTTSNDYKACRLCRYARTAQPGTGRATNRQRHRQNDSRGTFAGGICAALPMV